MFPLDVPTGCCSCLLYSSSLIGHLSSLFSQSSDNVHQAVIYFLQIFCNSLFAKFTYCNLCLISS